MAKEKTAPEKAEAKPAAATPRDAKPAEAKAADAAPAPQRKKRGMAVALLGVLSFVAAGAFGYQYVRDRPAKPETARPPQFVAPEMFTVNLRDDGTAEHFLQVGLTYQVAGSDVADAMKLHMPVIRSRILLLLTAHTPSELGTPEGKARLSQELLAAARAPLPGEAEDRGVLAVHYSAFIIQ